MTYKGKRHSITYNQTKSTRVPCSAFINIHCSQCMGLSFHTDRPEIVFSPEKEALYRFSVVHTKPFSSLVIDGGFVRSCIWQIIRSKVACKNAKIKEFKSEASQEDPVAV